MANGEPGRPTRATPVVVKALIDALSGGSYIRTACAYVGISVSSYDLWNERGAAEMERASFAGIDVNQAIIGATMVYTDGRPSALPLEKVFENCPKGFHVKEWPYVIVHHQAQKARAVAEIRNLTLIQQAAPDQWQAAAWILERTHPEHYGRRERINLEGSKDGSAVAVEISSAEALANRIEEWRKKNG